MDNATFPDGLRAFKPNDNAPDFIKADLEIEKAKLIAWLSGQPDKVRLQIKLSKKGTYYAQVNDYQAKPKEQVASGVDPFDGLPF